MLPLTIGHARLLEALRLWNATEPSELCVASYICHREYQWFSRILGSRSLPLRLWYWRWTLGKDWDWERSKKAWANYITYHSDAPAVISTGKQEGLRMPLLAVMRIYLCEHVGYSPETFDDVLYSQAIVDYYGSLELNGSVRGIGQTVEELNNREEFAA
jgi:hypothetical protein